MKVRYEGEKYQASLTDKLYIDFWKFILFLKRQKRRIKILLSKKDICFYIIITLIWIGFGTFTYIFGQGYKATEKHPYRIVDVIWELKNSYFTSVVLAFSVSVINKIRDYKKKIRVQHYFYVDAMHDFEKVLYHFIGSAIQHYHPLYCQKTLDVTVDFLEKKDNILSEDEDIILSVDTILKRLDAIETAIKDDDIVITNSYSTLCLIEEAREEINRLVLSGKLKRAIK